MDEGLSCRDLRLLYVSLGHVQEAGLMYIGMMKDQSPASITLPAICMHMRQQGWFTVAQAVWEEMKDQLLGTEASFAKAREHTSQLQVPPGCRTL